MRHIIIIIIMLSVRVSHFTTAWCLTLNERKLKFLTKLQHSENVIRRLFEQDAQLSQRDRAAGCVIVFAKSRTLERGDNDLRIL